MLISPAAKVTDLPDRSNVSASCASSIPPTLIVTAPEVTAKSPAAKLATPFVVVVASSPVTVSVLPETLVVIPVPPATVNVVPSSLSDKTALSAVKPIVEFINLPLAIDPANWSFDTPPVLIATSPDVTTKSPVVNVATPFWVELASAAVIVSVLATPSTDVEMP